MVDYFSKGAHFGALPHHHSAYKVAQLFLDMVCKLHGFPCSLISDRDPILACNFWRELFRLSSTKFQINTAYHPQTNDQIEIVNHIWIWSWRHTEVMEQHNNGARAMMGVVVIVDLGWLSSPTVVLWLICLCVATHQHVRVMICVSMICSWQSAKGQTCCVASTHQRGRERQLGWRRKRMVNQIYYVFL